MSTIYTGSNYGIISTANSGNGNLTISGNTTNFSFENVQNYTTGTILINLTSNGYATLTINYSNDQTGSIVSNESYILTKIGSQTINFAPKGNYLKLVLTANTNNVGYTIQTRYNNSGSNFDLDDGVISSSNSAYLASLGATGTVSGSYDEIYNYSLITISINGIGPTGTTDPAPGNITCYFSSDGINIDRTVSYPVQDCTAISTTSTTSTTFNPTHTLIPITKYFKVEYQNGAIALTNFRLTILYHKSKSKPATSRVTQFLTDYVDTDSVRSILNGRTEGTLLPGGSYENITVANGNINVKIKEPITSFGELLNCELVPNIQVDFTNGRPLDKINFYQNDITHSSYNFVDSKCQINTLSGGSILSKIELKSSIYTKYKPGQGNDNRFTARFPNGYVANHNQYAGIFTPIDSLTFGYFDGQPEFAIRHTSFGTRQLNRFIISSAATSTSTLVLTFGTTAVNVSIVSGDTQLIIAKKICETLNLQIGLNTYGWRCEYYNLSTSDYYIDCLYNYATSTLILVSITTNTTGATISLSTPNPLNSGVTPTIEVIPQSQWNIDTCKNMGSLQQNYLLNKSGFILDPTKGNVFKIVFQYLGFGSMTFYIELTETETLVPVHRIKYSNSNLKPSLKNPNMQIGIGLEQVNVTTSASTLEVGGFASFLQGSPLRTSINRSYGNIITGNTTSGLASLSRTSPGILFGFKPVLIYESTNSDGSKLYTVNNNNIYISTINCSVNTSSNATANIIFVLVKNPTSITTGRTVPTTSYPAFTKNNNSLIEIFNGTTISDATTGSVLVGGEIVLEFSLSENQNTSENIVELQFLMGQFDSYYFGFYGSTSASCDIVSSISFQVNM